MTRTQIAQLSKTGQTFGELLRAAREGDEATLSTYASRLGISAANLCDLEQGRKLVRPRRALAIAKALDLPAAIALAASLRGFLAQEGVHYAVVAMAEETLELRKVRRSARNRCLKQETTP